MTARSLPDEVRQAGIRPPGRPRSSEVSLAILRAVVAIIAEEGNIGGVTVDAIAERSGVSKATIYRRWASREELIAAAVDSIKEPHDYDLPNTSVRDDLLTIAAHIRRDVSPGERTVLNCVGLELRSNPLLKEFHDRLHQRRRAFVRQAFELGVERGEIRADVDLDLAVVMFISPLVSITAYGNSPELATPDLGEQIVDSLLAGMSRGRA